MSLGEAPRLGRDVGARVGELSRLLQPLERRLFDRVHLDASELRAQLAEHPRLTYVIAHSGVISWLPITTLLVNRVAAHAPERLGTGTFHKAMWALPGLSRVASWFSGASRHLCFDELLAALSSGECDFYAFPESDASLYGAVGEVKPFRFFRFIELSVQARMPMLLVAHKGSEDWYYPLRRVAPLLEPIPRRLFELLHLKKEQVLDEAERQLVNLPVPLRRISLKVRTELMKPLAWEHGFSPDPAEKKAQLAVEAERLRARLQELTDSLA